jgi:hypothetical protein
MPLAEDAAPVTKHALVLNSQAYLPRRPDWANIFQVASSAVYLDQNLANDMDVDRS